MMMTRSSLPPNGRHAFPSPRRGLRRLYYCCLGLTAWIIALSLGTVNLPFPGREVLNQPTDGEATSVFQKSSELIDHFVRPARIESEPKRELPSSKVFMAGPWVPTQIIQNNSLHEPNLEFHMFNYTSMALSVKLIDRELREKAGLDGAWDAWRSLRPWAFKVDLWRYMILWSEGGLYIDSKVRLTASVTLWAALSKQEDFASCLYHNYKVTSQKFPNDEPIQVLCNGILSARKGSLVMLEAIRLIIGIVANRTYVLPYFEKSDIYGRASLSVTGPILLGYAAKDFVRNGSARIVPCAVHSDGDGCYLERSTERFYELDSTEHTRVRELSGGNKYVNLYGDELVYCDSKLPFSDPDIACDLDALLNATQIQGI